MHFLKHVLYTCFFLFVFGQYTFGQDTTRYVKPSTKFFTERSIDRGLDYQQIDTNINRVEIFHPCYKDYTVFQDLGNIGTPSRPLVFDITRQTGFSYAMNPFEIYSPKPETANYFNTKTPYTDLFYSQGSNEMLYLKALHSQNILPRWNAGVDYTRVSSEGFQLRQHTSLYSLRFFTAFHSKNKRYLLLADATWNKGVVEESGGIQSDSSYESLSGRSRQVYSNLTASQTRYKNRVGYLKQYFRFGTPSTILSGEDSIYDFRNRLQLSHTLNAEEISYIFENNGDTNSLLLPHQYYDVGTSTFDSAYYGKLSNRLQLQYFNPRTLLLNSKDSVMDVFSGGIKYDMINVSQKPFVRQFNNLILEGSYENVRTKDHSTRLLAKADYVLSGYNQGDYSATANINYRFNVFSVDALADVRAYRPDFAMMLFKSNQFIWENNFKQTLSQHLGVELSTLTFRNNFHINYHIYQLENWVYAGLNQTPEQTGTAVTIQRVGFNKTFRIWKFFLEHNLYYQTSSSTVVRLPELSGMIRYYFQARLFKVMRFQLGFDAFYNSAYYGNAYNPATRMFYLQNDTRIGNYPFIDPFFIGEIKRAALFFKYEHVNQGWMNSGFYYTPHYPVSQSSFRFGIRWRFYD